ncbi:unnamed protein product [Rotaria socialis]|uniref:Uncharacterized protein n=1 Tax=Rotaria socialis TaxID=392032 RepID=A0A817MXQ1_9BILA|nr:unnamed protein product [Rotaria socialis]CAF3487445.1 unnamed protein product [Rotaria socialis]CAF3674107.1 unnamed protein product [Rotaria socialis]CAF4417581.1 unnamed protein product [Rotaria socialis]CAF4446422.1 unnamed protein product [Rotaria socialis]
MILIHQIKAPKDKGLDKRSKDLWTLNDSNEDGSRDEIEPKSVETRQDEHDVKGRNDEENGKTAVDGMPDIGKTIEMQTTRSSVISVPSASSKLPVKRSRTM